MGITNQQIADLLEKWIETSAGQADAFASAVEKLIENGNRHQEEHRRRLEDLALAQAHLKADVDQNTDLRKKLSALILAVVLVPIGTTIIQLVLK